MHTNDIILLTNAFVQHPSKQARKHTHNLDALTQARTNAHHRTFPIQESEKNRNYHKNGNENDHDDDDDCY